MKNILLFLLMILSIGLCQVDKVLEYQLYPFVYSKYWMEDSSFYVWQTNTLNDTLYSDWFSTNNGFSGAFSVITKVEEYGVSHDTITISNQRGTETLIAHGADSGSVKLMFQIDYGEPFGYSTPQVLTLEQEDSRSTTVTEIDATSGNTYIFTSDGNTDWQGDLFLSQCRYRFLFVTTAVDDSINTFRVKLGTVFWKPYK